MYRVVTILLATMLAHATAAVAAPTLADGMAAYADGDPRAAFEIFEALSASGDAEAQVRLGILYYNGEGVDESDEQAFFWFRRAAEAGLAEGQYHLGYLYQYGFGVPAEEQQPYVQAAKWFRAAAEQQHAPAAFALGLMYLAGTGVEENRSEGMRWLRLASELGSEEARGFLAGYEPESSNKR